MSTTYLLKVADLAIGYSCSPYEIKILGNSSSTQYFKIIDNKLYLLLDPLILFEEFTNYNITISIEDPTDRFPPVQKNFSIDITEFEIGLDIFPLPVSWDNLEHYDVGSGGYEIDSSTKQITDINTDIVLEVEYDNSLNNLYYQISNNPISFNTGSFDNINEFLSSNPGLISINNNGTFTISNNQYLLFTSWPTDDYNTTTVTVKNTNVGSTVFDEFDIIFS